jgi:hypothetical protein
MLSSAQQLPHCSSGRRCYCKCGTVQHSEQHLAAATAAAAAAAAIACVDTP